MTELVSCPSLPSHSGPRSIRVALPGGICMNVREWGVGEHVCLLIHGFGEGGFVWSRFANALRSQFRLLAVDLRGHGDSDRDASGKYHNDTYYNDILHLIDKLRLKRLTLIGHSLGASLAIRTAATLNERIASLVIVDYAPGILPAGREYVRSSFREQLRCYASPVEYANQLAAMRPLAEPEFLSQLALDALRPSGDRAFELKCDPVLGESNAHDVDDESLRIQLRSITCPALIVRGAGSALVSRQCVREMKQLLQRADWRDIPMAGHSVVIDNPAGFLAAVEPFLLRSGRAFSHTIHS